VKLGLRGALQEELDAMGAKGLKRELQPLATPGHVREFTSNDYLGLSSHPEIREAGVVALQKSGNGARASRLLGGGCATDEEAEQRLAAWLKAEAALLFPTGYQANLGLVTCLAQAGDVLLCDELIHASMIDACRLSKARRVIFGHSDLEQLEEHLKRHQGARRRLVLIESIYSMDGDRAPVEALNELCERYDAWLLVDEAHAVGVCGPQGAGLACPTEACGFERVLARVVTGGKALGCAGGFVVGSAELRELLIHRARSFIYSTGIAPAVSAGLCTAIELARAASSGRASLHDSAARLASALRMPVPVGPILSFIVGENQAAMELAQSLQADGYEVRAVRPPTVAPGSARLRIVLHSFNSSEAIDGLARRLQGKELKIEATGLVQRAQAHVVVGTDTDIGKTITSAIIARCLAAASSEQVTYWKPVQTGDDSDTNTVRLLTEGQSVCFAEPTYEFPLPASPHEAAAAAGESIDFDRVLRAYDEQLNKSAPGHLLIELAGGLFVPYDDRHTQADWLERIRPRILLVARSGLGTLNHTLLTLEALRTRGLEPEVLFLVGEPHTSNSATLRERGGVPLVVEVPRFSDLTPSSLQSWIEANPLNLL
jgi:8-amino-7-oxononanoate synthase